MITIDPVKGGMLVLLLIAALYRVHKRWLRRCDKCGAMWRIRRRHEKHFECSLGHGRSLAYCTTYKTCLNPNCPDYGIEQEEKSYPKEVPTKLLRAM